MYLRESNCRGLGQKSSYKSGEKHGAIQYRWNEDQIASPCSYQLQSTLNQRPWLGLNLSYDGQVRACSPRHKVLQLMLGKDIFKTPIPVALAVIMGTLTVEKVPSSHSVLGSISANKSTDGKCCTNFHIGELGNKMMETLRKRTVSRCESACCQMKF